MTPGVSTLKCLAWILSWRQSLILVRGFKVRVKVGPRAGPRRSVDQEATFVLRRIAAPMQE